MGHPRCPATQLCQGNGHWSWPRGRVCTISSAHSTAWIAETRRLSQAAKSQKPLPPAPSARRLTRISGEPATFTLLGKSILPAGDGDVGTGERGFQGLGGGRSGGLHEDGDGVAVKDRRLDQQHGRFADRLARRWRGSAAGCALRSGPARGGRFRWTGQKG